MGETAPPEPTLRLLAAFSRHRAALDWARQRACQAWGPLAMESPIFQFAETDYYQPTMGAELGKVFFVFEQLYDPGETVATKLETNAWERDYAAHAAHSESRPLNLDPGYLSSAKLVLSSTKDHAHRIYLNQGIYAEVTLHYKHHRWQHHDWTFPDYRRADYQQFFVEARKLLRTRLKQEGR